MPAKAVSEISSGAQFSRSSNEGQLADTATRVFRILMDDVAQPIDPQVECQVSIGDEHPVSLGTYCTSFDLRYEGDSRMVYLVTFQYQTTPSSSSSGGGGDPKSQPPDVRPANWSTSSSLIEIPVYTWQPTFADDGFADGDPVVPKNFAGDRFDSITKYEPMVTISVEHFETIDPTRNAALAGVINKTEYRIESLICKPHTLMLRGITSRPIAEFWNDRLYRGWIATYELAYRKNHVKGLYLGGPGEAVVDADIGWDIAVPNTGFNVIAFAPALALPNEDIFGQPLKHDAGKIVDDPVEQLPDGVAVGDRVRAMVKVFEYENGGTSQLPSAQPIPLNSNGSSRKSFGQNAAVPPVIIKRYRIYEEYEFNDFKFRGLGT